MSFEFRPTTPAAHASAAASSSAAHRPCYCCGELGHLVRNCPKKVPRKPGAARSCFACGESGHFARDCPQKSTPTPTLAPIPAAATRNRGSATPGKPGAARRIWRRDVGGSSRDGSWVPSSTHAARGGGSMRGCGGRGDSGIHKASQDSIRRRGLLPTPFSGYSGKGDSEPYKATREGMQMNVFGSVSYRNVDWKFDARGSSASSSSGTGDICDDHNRNDGDRWFRDAFLYVDHVEEKRAGGDICSYHDRSDGGRGFGDAFVSSCVDEEEKRTDGDICNNHNRNDGGRGFADAFLSSCVDEEEKRVDNGSTGKGDGCDSSGGGSKSNEEEGGSARKCVILTETSSSSSSGVDYDDNDYKDFDYWMYQTIKEAKTLFNEANVVVEKSHASVAMVNEEISGGGSRTGNDNSGKSCYNTNMLRRGCPVVIEISSSSSEDDDDEDDDNDNFLNSGPTLSRWMAHQNNTSYLAPTMKVKEERRPVDDDDDDEDDCVILDYNPFELPTADFEQKVSLSDHNPSSVHDDDISVISERGQVACRDYPHSRHHCAKFPFSKTTHESFCPQCYCYVCEIVAPCDYWEGSSGHCHASDHDPLWGVIKKIRRDF